MRWLVVACMQLSLLVVATSSWSVSDRSISYCTQADFLDREHPEQQEALCLQYLKHSASRRGDVLSLKVDDGSYKTYRSNPAACEKEDANNCVRYHLVGFNEAARLYIILIGRYDELDCMFVSARNGAETGIGDLPYFAPDGQTFIVFFVGDGYAVGSVAGVSPSLTRVYWADHGENWTFLAWLDLDHVALKFDGQSMLCPDGNCEAILVRTRSGWVLQRKS